MNRQLARQSLFHALLSALMGKAPELAKQQVQSPRRPIGLEPSAWHAYWEDLGQPWRTEPEINQKRQAELEHCRANDPDPEKDVYPFRGMKLSRADIEWLLVTHENGRGPVLWSDESQREREGLDLRGADLSVVNLSDLPLTRLCGGRSPGEEYEDINTNEMRYLEERCRRAALSLQHASLFYAHLEEADLSMARLEGADLSLAMMQGASLYSAQMMNTNCEKADLKGANLGGAVMDGVCLDQADLTGTNLSGARIENTSFWGAYLEGAVLMGAQLKEVNLGHANLAKADLRKARLEWVNLEGIIWGNEKGVAPQIADVLWNNVNLTVVDWSRIRMLGDEHKAREETRRDRAKKYKSVPLREYEEAIRANRQLAMALGNQGLNEDAARFAYRAQVLQKTFFRLQMIQSGVNFRYRSRMLGAWLFSWFLFLLAGYGYKFWRSFLSYLFIIGSFLGFYLLISLFTTPHLTWDEALVLSMSSFHGRGFFPSNVSLGDPYARLSVVEGFVGLFVEVTLIATFTQRFFSK